MSTEPENECPMCGGEGGWPGVAGWVMCKPCKGTGKQGADWPAQTPRSPTDTGCGVFAGFATHPGGNAAHGQTQQTSD